MIDTIPTEEHVTYTYTSPKGVVFVITDVPALVVENSRGDKEVRYKPAASRVVNRYVREGLKLFSEPSVHTVSFRDASYGGTVDAQIRAVGPQVSRDNSSIEVWQTVTNSIFQSYSAIRKAVKDIRGLKDFPYPTVKTVEAGSLVFGLKATPIAQVGLFNEEHSIPDEIQILQLLIDGHAFLKEEKIRDESILEYPQVQSATIKAIEKLSPRENSVIEEIQLIPRSKIFVGSEPVTFTSRTHNEAKRRRKQLEQEPDEQDRRNVEIVGQIAALYREGRMTIRDVEYNYPDGARHPTSAIFHDSIFEKLVDFFKKKKRVMFRGIEYKTYEGWTSQPIIKQVEEAPPREEVERLAS